MPAGTAKSDGTALPGTLRVFLLLPIVLVVVFIFSAPWTAAGRTIDRLTWALGVGLLLALSSILHRPWRKALAAGFLNQNHVFGWRTLLILFACSTTFLLRVILSRYQALDVNAWDFSVYEFAVRDSPNGTVLFSPLEGRSQLGTHASYLLFLFPPLYRLWSSHLWLLAAHAVAIGAAIAVAFAVCRRLAGDDLAGLLVALGLLLNSFTAKTIQYVFHAEVFYPVCLFLVAYGIVREMPVVFLAAVLLTSLVKEDSVIPLLGISLAGLVFARRRWQWWLASAAIAAAAFSISSFLVIPRFSGRAPGDPWYMSMWSAYGAAPVQAGLGILWHPLRVAEDLARSGAKDVLETLGFLPLIGYEWLLAALPALVVYGVSEGGRGGLARFSIYYSAAVLPILMIAAVRGLARLSALKQSNAGRRRAVRVGALGLLLVCAFDGASYVFLPPKPSRLDIASLRLPAHAPVRVQGALLPHFPLTSNIEPLTRLSLPTVPQEMVVLDLNANPYPFSSRELRSFSDRLVLSGFVVTRKPHGLLVASSPDR